jgi:hypothetical protein
MNREDDPKLWDLLGRGQKLEPSPFFARNVVRAVRLGQPEKPQWIGWLNLRRIVPTLSAVAAVLLMITAVETFHRHSAPPGSERIALADGQDPDLAADLEVLIGADDDSDDSALL